MNLIEELRWRGLIQDITAETEAYLSQHKVKGYVGFDPTADSLHIGNLVPVTLLMHLQRYGHTPVALVGGATGMIGDPSGKSAERQFLDEETLRYNESCQKAQLMRFLDFSAKDNAAILVNNFDWFQGMGFLTFLREVGKYVTINYMMAKDSVKGRIDNEQGISYTEFTYQLVQGYDFYHLYKEMGVQLQMGGADQWGNITTGSMLIRKKMEGEANVFALTAPLLVREDGTKFGKTAEGKNVWLDAKRTSPFEFYQYWLSISDFDAIKCLKIFSLRSLEEMEDLIAKHQETPHLRIIHKALGTEITERIHGKSEMEKAISLTDFLFGGAITAETLQGLSEETWQDVLANTSEKDRKTIASEKLQAGISLVELLADTTIVPSKSEAKRAIQVNKSISVNGIKIEEPTFMIDASQAYFGKYIFVQSGKKNRYVIEVEA